MGDPTSDVVTVILKPIVEGIYSRLKRQCDYFCCFHSNIQTLHKEATSIEVARADLQRKVDDARRNGLEIREDVKKWLEDTNMNQAKMVKIEDRIHNVQNYCLNIILRYSVSKQANKTAEAMVKLCNCNNFGDDVSLPLPPASMVPFPLEQIITLQSRNHIEEMIVEALGRPNNSIVGIGGTGGIGKTSLAEKIINRMMSGKLVDETVKVVVSQSVKVLEIQQSIAAQVRLKLDSETDKAARAHQLRTKLKSIGKKIIVLDDVWQQLNFTEIGIPSGSDSSGCKILLTSRNKHLLNQMGAQVFAMEILTKDDAWSLFKDKAGTCVEDPGLKPIAEEVLSECKGLPIAIVTVGSALKDQRIEIWKDALVQLKNAKPTDIDGVEKYVYNSLRLSYDHLDSEGAKSLFLLCCIFPEDFEISLESLAVYGMGLNMFDRGDSLSRARNQVFTIVEKLKSCSLLLDGKDEYHVKMHDVVRDVARFIAREGKLIHDQLVLKGQHASNCKWDFIQNFSEGSNYKIGTNFQCLHLLIIQHKTWGMMDIDGFPCVGGMPDLKVLSLKRCSFKSPPQWNGLLENLKTLELNNCPLESLSFVGELMGLEILKCKRCDEIEELPIEIGNLSRLTLLDLNSCDKLRRIRAGVISKLIELEELKILNSFKEWEATQIVNEAEMEQNASLKELESLQKLTWLEIEIANIELVKENMRFPENIIKYDIQIGSYRFTHKDKAVSSYPCLLTKHNHCFGSWIHKFVSAAEEIRLYGNWSNKFILSDCFGSMVKTLRVENGEKLVSLVNTSRMSTDLRKHGVFPVLEHMELSNLPDLKHICDGPIQKGLTSFGDLRELNLSYLPSLKKLVISDCEKMEEVFLMEKNEQVGKKSKLAFPNMVEMEISDMPNLTMFVKGIESIEFPSLMNLFLINSPKLKWMDFEDGHSNDEYSLHYFCNKKVTFGMLKKVTVREYNIARSLWCGQISLHFFGKLEELTVSGCNKIKILCSFPIAKNLIHLKSLRIERCDDMEHLIGVENQIHPSSTTGSDILEGYSINEEKEDGGMISFPKLEMLQLASLKNFKTLCGGIKTLQFPMLLSLTISRGLKVIKSNENQTDGCDCDNDSLHFFCGEQLPSFGLKQLNIYDYDDVSNLWCQQIPPCFLHTLEDLTIQNCPKLKSAFPYSVAKHLLNLKQLAIWGCGEMEKVVSGVEKETHEQNSILLFPSLVELNLLHVPSLEMFCERGCCLTLPSLEKVRVDWRKVRKSTYTDEGMEDWNNLLCQHILMSKKKEEERQQQRQRVQQLLQRVLQQLQERQRKLQQQQELGEIQEAPEISGQEEEDAETSEEDADYSSTPMLDEELLRHNRLASPAATDEELNDNKDDLHVEAIPSLSGQEFGSHNAPDMVPRPVPDQAESSTTAAQRSATMDKMTAEITYPDQLIEQQSAQHDG